MPMLSGEERRWIGLESARTHFRRTSGNARVASDARSSGTFVGAQPSITGGLLDALAGDTCIVGNEHLVAARREVHERDVTQPVGEPRRELGWQARYCFNDIIGRLKAGNDWRSPLARMIGSKGYHAEAFPDRPYPVE